MTFFLINYVTFVSSTARRWRSSWSTKRVNRLVNPLGSRVPFKLKTTLARNKCLDLRDKTLETYPDTHVRKHAISSDRVETLFLWKRIISGRHASTTRVLTMTYFASIKHQFVRKKFRANGVSVSNQWYFFVIRDLKWTVRYYNFEKKPYSFSQSLNKG